MKKRFPFGFTLVEVLLVVAIIAILAAIVTVAINPTRQIAQTNNAERRAHVNSILNAINQYQVGNRGALPAAITTTATVMGSGTGLIDICASLVPTYLPNMPFDKIQSGAKWASCTDYNTGYTVIKDANNRVTVAAPGVELGETISVQQ